MDTEQVPYVHLLVFRCKRCRKALAVFVASVARNVEKIDGDSHDVRCLCGWTENLLGVEAVRHWVMAREETQAAIGVPQVVPNERPTTPHKFPEGSANRDYDVFVELPDGSRH